MCKMGGALGGGVEKFKENVEGMKKGRINISNVGATMNNDWSQLYTDIQGMGEQDYGKQLRQTMDQSMEGNIFDKQDWTIQMSGGGGPLIDEGDETITTNIEQSPTGSGKASGQDALDPAMLRIMNKMGKTDTKREMLTSSARTGPGLRLTKAKAKT